MSKVLIAVNETFLRKAYKIVPVLVGSEVTETKSVRLTWRQTENTGLYALLLGMSILVTSGLELLRAAALQLLRFLPDATESGKSYAK